jgi:hypothetical protein
VSHDLDPHVFRSNSYVLPGYQDAALLRWEAAPIGAIMNSDIQCPECADGLVPALAHCLAKVQAPVMSSGGRGIEGIEQHYGAAGQVGCIAGDESPPADPG